MTKKTGFQLYSFSNLGKNFGTAQKLPIKRLDISFETISKPQKWNVVCNFEVNYILYGT
jgi:hypothetical protein